MAGRRDRHVEPIGVHQRSETLHPVTTEEGSRRVSIGHDAVDHRVPFIDAFQTDRRIGSQAFDRRFAQRGLGHAEPARDLRGDEGRRDAGDERVTHLERADQRLGDVAAAKARAVRDHRLEQRAVRLAAGREHAIDIVERPLDRGTAIPPPRLAGIE